MLVSIILSGTLLIRWASRSKTPIHTETALIALAITIVMIILITVLRSSMTKEQRKAEERDREMFAAMKKEE